MWIRSGLLKTILNTNSECWILFFCPTFSRLVLVFSLWFFVRCPIFVLLLSETKTSFSETAKFFKSWWLMRISSLLDDMAIPVVEFSNGGTKLEMFLPKNQCTQRKLLNFENWISGKFSKIRVLKINYFHFLFT